MSYKIKGNVVVDDNDRVYARNLYHLGDRYNLLYGHLGQTTGYSIAGTNPAVPAQYDSVDAFPLTGTGFTASNVGALREGGMFYVTACSSRVTDKCYKIGGMNPSSPGSASAYHVDYFPHANPWTTSTFAGYSYYGTPAGVYGGAAVSGDQYAFYGGDHIPSTYTTDLQKFPFHSPWTNMSLYGSTFGYQISIGNAVQSSDHGFFAGTSIGGYKYVSAIPFAGEFFQESGIWTDLTANSFAYAACNSTTDGYFVGGTMVAPGPSYNLLDKVDKFPFARTLGGVTTTDVGNLSLARATTGGVSSTSGGYVLGGTYTYPPSYVSQVDFFPFHAPFTTTTDVGDLVSARGYLAGSEY